MKKLITDFIKVNKILFLEYKYRNEVPPKTGLSINERKRILTETPYSKGVASLYNQTFIYPTGMAFVHSIDEIFSEEIYKFNSKTEEPYIIDCGANIGLSIYYFKKLFPKAKILAFEPDDIIFEMLEKNVGNIANNQNIELKKEAIWIEETYLDFFSEGSLAGSCTVDFAHKNNTYKTKATDLKKYLNRKIDFLKVDIEGAENEVIFDIKDFLKNVNNLFLEFHGLTGKPQNLDKILSLLSETGFQYYIKHADDIMKFPFCKQETHTFNQQLNIFCFRP